MNLNKALIIGNLTRDPELRQTATGQTVVTFGIATNRFYTDQSGQKQKQAEFHNIVAWGRLGEICNQYLKKGDLAFVEGRIQNRTWQDQQGMQRNRSEIIAERIQLGPKIGGPRQENDFNGGGEPQIRRSNAPMSNSSMMSKNAGDDAPPIIELPPDGDEIDIKDIPF